MKTFSTSVIELRQPFENEVLTHPFECGWADEALFFVELHDADEGTTLTLRVQLSADGIRWLDEGIEITTSGSTFARVAHFGGFLRLAGSATDRNGAATPVTVSVRLALKG